MSSSGARGALERDDEGDWIDAELLADDRSMPGWQERLVAAVQPTSGTNGGPAGGPAAPDPTTSG